MRRLRALLPLALAGMLLAETVGERELRLAEERLAKLEKLVAEGAVPRHDFEMAKNDLEDARDTAFLQSTLYGEDLSGAQAEMMLEVIERRIARRQEAVDRQKELIAAGGAPQVSLTDSLAKLDYAKRERDFAESRLRTIREIAVMERASVASASTSERGLVPGGPIAERFDGKGVFSSADVRKAEQAFMRQFGKLLPVSAIGETALHRSLGFDHRGRVDVALHPDDPEGLWLRGYLMEQGIPFYAFRGSLQGKATGAHIHIGPASGHYTSGT